MKLTDLDQVTDLCSKRDEIGAFLELMTEDPGRLIKIGGWHSIEGITYIQVPESALSEIRAAALVKLDEIDGQLKALGVVLDRGPNEDDDDIEEAA